LSALPLAAAMHEAEPEPQEPEVSQTGEVPCLECGGSGRRSDGSVCPSCQGSGRVLVTVGDA
jgi:DnaJ-class molecular chaperone